ncbi:hypothetical protein DL766_010607 [Monosporascus sp. MC13-8B]|uniref:Uncharacterized protein n=1 Tax=Monosporascus cannonballus TaxID=155416 RepID=A0ABY0H2U0_9PEZI|nr:hypothetical protein DL762_006148 [Monosporascus cannonballus]RYO90955.1 hypothetical protein DL763_005126 [Monosporascus cannonballus]RYP01966.1 hypothetical protein DL766_010607 [Monosporascus sp. MC13-8B]
MFQIFRIVVGLLAAVSVASSRSIRTVVLELEVPPSRQRDVDASVGRATMSQASPTGSLPETRNDKTSSRGITWTCPQQATRPTNNDQDREQAPGPGIKLMNHDDEVRSFYFYWNSCDSIPYAYLSMPARGSRFVSLPAGFQGRVTRGTDETHLSGQPQLLGTWVELSFPAGDDRGGWGDVSLIRGCDGAATVRALDGSGLFRGFENWVLDGAPREAYDTKESGAEVIRAIGDVTIRQEAIARDYLLSKVNLSDVYVDNEHGNPVIFSANSRFAVTFFKGRP